MKNFIRKLIVSGIIILCLGTSYPTFWEYSIQGNPYTSTNNDCDTNPWKCTNIYDDIDITNQDSIINRLLSVFGLDSDTINQDKHKFINYAKAILNIALWLISLIALIMTIYTFYMIFFTDNDKWVEKAKWKLVGIFVALAIIGLSWLIVSFIFRWYQSNWQNALT